MKAAREQVLALLALANAAGGYLASARGVIPDRGELEAKAKSLFGGKTE